MLVCTLAGFAQRFSKQEAIAADDSITRHGLIYARRQIHTSPSSQRSDDQYIFLEKTMLAELSSRLPQRAISSPSLALKYEDGLKTCKKKKTCGISLPDKKTRNNLQRKRYRVDMERQRPDQSIAQVIKCNCDAFNRQAMKSLILTSLTRQERKALVDISDLACLLKQ